MGSSYKSPGLPAADKAKLNTTYTIVNSNSADWSEHFDSTAIASASGDWENLSNVLSSNGVDLVIPTNNNVVLGNHDGNEFKVIHTADVHFIPISAENCSNEGSLYYEDENHTLTLVSDISDARLQIGQENWVRIKNKTGSQVDNGTLVYIASSGPGVGGQLPLIELAQANAEHTSAATLGFATHDISDDDEGYITTFGLVREIDLSSYNDGDILYLSPTVAGGFTSTKPQAPDHIVYVGTVVDSKNNGTLFAQIDNGWELDELHDVRINTNELENGDMLRYDNVSSVWVSSSAIQVTDSDITLNETLCTKSIRVGPENTDTFYLTNSATVWNDAVYPLVQTPNANQSNSALLEQWGTGGLFVMQFTDGNNQTWPVVQIPHDWKGTKVYPHIHWCANDADTGSDVVWGLELTWTGIPGGTWEPNSTITYYGTGQTAGQFTQVITDIPASGIEPSTFGPEASSISSIMVCRLFVDYVRTNTGLTIDGVSFDVHYEVDSLGSENIVQKFYA